MSRSSVLRRTEKVTGIGSSRTQRAQCGKEPAIFSPLRALEDTIFQKTFTLVWILKGTPVTCAICMGVACVVIVYMECKNWWEK